jgi:hypothetical protein
VNTEHEARQNEHKEMSDRITETHCPDIPPGLTIGSNRVVTNILCDKMKWLARAVGAAAKIGRTARRDLMATIMRADERVERLTGSG